MNTKRKVVHIVGARPNFMKLAPVFLELDNKVAQLVIHTGQHYDRRMSGDFFDILDLPEPDFNLAVGAMSHAVRIKEVIKGLSLC